MVNAPRLLALSVSASLLAAIVLAPLQGHTAIAPPGSVSPVRPNVTLGTEPVTPSGRVIQVPVGGNFQAALNAAHSGDAIELPAGAAFAGNFILPDKPGTEWIVIRSSAYERLPPPGSRVSPAHAVLMPKVVSPNTSPTIKTDAGAHNYRFVGVEITTKWTSTSRTNYNLIYLESPGGNTSLTHVPTDIIFDRCYIHGTPTGNVRRGIAMNSARTAVVDSYLSDFHEVGADSQAIASWNGPGPFKIVNNYLEGAGENVMFGGADPTIPNLVPSDIEIRGNHFAKPLTWRAGDPTYTGSQWSVKNLFELKNAQRVLVDGNIFEHNWPSAQNGFSILFTVRNQDGAAPWSVVQDVTFIHNVVRHVSSAVNILGRDDIHSSEQTKRILIQNNLFDDVNGSTWGGFGRLFQVLNGTANLMIDHNTAFETGSPVNAAAAPNAGFIFTNNIAPNQGGVGGDNTWGNPLLTLSTYFPGSVFAGNALAGGNPSSYPANNYFPPSLDAVGFVNLTGGDYTLAPSSRYKRAGTDGKDIGADITVLPTNARP
jgi:hypothetical protein